MTAALPLAGLNVPPRKPPRRLLSSPSDLFSESQAGILISGDSGFGKSNAMRVFLQQLARRGFGFLFISPHNEDPHAMRDWCLSQSASIRRRMVYIEPADTSRVCCINPLAVPECDDPMKRDAQICAKVGHVGRILLAAWGESEQGFESRPRLYTWTTRILTTLARLGMAIADAKHFLDIGSKVYHSLVQAVPDVIARHAFENLAEMRPGDQSDQIESTRNRMLGFLSNPIVEAMLGRTDDILDIGRLRQERKIVIVNLRRGGVLREEDQQIFANLFLAELLHDTFNAETPIPYFAFLDELPVFARGSGPELTAAAGQIRKFGLRLVCATQGGNPFPERYEDRLLHALIGQCGLHFLFRHKNPADAKFFGELIGLPTYDPMRVKHELRQEQQYQDGHDLTVLMDTNQSTTKQESTGGSENTGTTETDQWSYSETSSTGSTISNSRSDTRTTGRSQNVSDVQERQLREAVSKAHAAVSGTSDTTTSGRSSTRGGSVGRTTQTGRNWSSSTGSTFGHTFKQTLVPRLRWRSVVTSITYFSPEEHMLTNASLLASLSIGQAVVNGRERPVLVQFPLADAPGKRTPRFIARRWQSFRLILDQYFQSPQETLARRQRFLQCLVEELDAMSAKDDPGDDPFPQ